MYDPALFRDIARPVPLGRLRSPALDPMWRLAHITQKRREKNVFAMRTLSCGVLPKQKTALSTHPFRATCVYKQAQTYQPMKYETAYAGRYRKHHKHTAAILASGEGPVIAKKYAKRSQKVCFFLPPKPDTEKIPKTTGAPAAFSGYTSNSISRSSRDRDFQASAPGMMDSATPFLASCRPKIFSSTVFWQISL